MLIASLSGAYSGSQWKIAGGTMSSSDAQKMLTKAGFSKAFLEKFANNISTNHSPRKQKSNNDFAHIMGSLSGILNPNMITKEFMKIGTSGTGTLGILVSLGNIQIGKRILINSGMQNENNIEASATYRGDIASGVGGISINDVRADADALNIANRIHKGSSINKSLKNYGHYIYTGGNRITELEKNIEKSELKRRIYTPITDGGDLAIEGMNHNGFGGTTRSADKFWRLIQDEKGNRNK